ncbi:response regulator [Deinococcus depolymerans]
MSDRLTVLVVDDNLADLLLLEEVFEEHAAEVDLLTFRSGPDVLAYLRDPACPLPDVLLLDWLMPAMNGQEVLESLRAEPRLRGLPVMVLSGHALDVPGTLACLIKQASLEGLMASVDRMIGELRSRRALPSAAPRC